ncbi:MAG TPA: nucleotidyltransferase family protein [Solirubrobacteraceae bacterium]|jgi:hypothetical protein|nr:nucleotidyltransferase family protein [Solirubrobacteraceae bacterium]
MAGPEQQLIRLCAGTALRRREMAAEGARLVEMISWQRLTATLYQRRLLATLGPRLIEFGGANDGFREAVDQAISTGRRHGAFLQLVSLRAIAMLAEVGISATVLKGPLLGEAIYGDPGRRPSSDIDLLVSPEQLRAAVEVVQQLGFAAPVDHVYDDGLPLLHFVLVHERGELPAVELHWRVHWYERRFATDRLLPPVPDPRGTWRPSPRDELASLLLFYARDGFVDLRLASDLSAWWDVRGEDLAPGALNEVISTYPGLARVIPAAVHVAEKIVGLPGKEVLGPMPKSGLRWRAAARLANPHPQASSSQLYADIGLIDGLLAPRGSFGAFLRRNLMPPPEVRDQQARHGARRRARSRLGRSAGVLARYGLTVTRLLPGRASSD